MNIDLATCLTIFFSGICGIIVTYSACRRFLPSKEKLYNLELEAFAELVKIEKTYQLKENISGVDRVKYGNKKTEIRDS